MLAETKARIEAAGGAMENFMVDVADRDAMFDLAATVEKQYGPADLILNNAGVAFGAPVAEMQIDDFKWLMDINFWGVVNGTQAFAAYDCQRQRPCGQYFIHIRAYQRTDPERYNAAKYGVLGFTDALRHEMRGTDINVSTIHPGGINTNIVRHARIQQGPDAKAEHEEAIERFAQFTMTQPDGAAKVIMKAFAKTRRAFSSALTRILSIG